MRWVNSHQRSQDSVSSSGVLSKGTDGEGPGGEEDC